MPRLFLLFGFACLTACQHLPSTTTTTETTPAPLSQKEQAKQILDKGIVAYQAKDYATALPFFQQAQTLGHSKASRYLGLMALNGYGMAQNPQRAFEYFTTASQAGDTTGQYWLAHCYEQGIGTTKDVKQAFYWYQNSSKRNDHVSAPSIFALGRFYEYGIAVEPNMTQALTYYRQAADIGDENAKLAIARLQSTHD